MFVTRWKKKTKKSLLSVKGNTERNRNKGKKKERKNITHKTQTKLNGARVRCNVKILPK